MYIQIYTTREGGKERKRKGEKERRRENSNFEGTAQPLPKIWIYPRVSMRRGM